MNSNDRADFWAGRTVALTGATGFVGWHLASLLVRKGARVTALVRACSACDRLLHLGVRCEVAPLDDAAAMARACRGSEYLFHLAGAVDFEGDWDRFRRVNVEGTRNVVAAARAGGVRRMIHASSIVAVGGSPRPALLDETASWNLEPLRAPYVTTKRLAEEVVLAESRRGLDAVVVNPASVVGPDDFTYSEFGTLCHRFWRGRIPFHFGGGNNFVDVRDAAIGCLLAAERGRAGERYLLGGANRSYTAFFGDLARAAGRPIFRLRLPTATAAVVARLAERFRRRSSRSRLTSAQARLLTLYFYFDSAKARTELGYRPRPWRSTLADAHTFWTGRRGA